MSRNYYEDLEIPRESNQNDIARAYRKLALRWHPDNCQEDPNTSNFYFNLVSEAYEVLSDPIRKAFYDKHGEEKLKSGLFTQTNLVGGYRYNKNAVEVYEKFFGEQDAFQQIFNANTEQNEGTIFGSAFGNQNFKGIQAPMNLVVKVPCTLNEIYNGCFKEISYQRVALNNDGRSTKLVDEKRTFQVTQGVADKTRIKFAGQGHQSQGCKPSDLICEIQELPQEGYKRKGNDLIKYVPITLAQALQSKPINFTSFDGRELQIAVDEVISPQTIKQVKGEGMYLLDNNGKRGDLFIKFNIKFPKQIEHSKLQELIQLLN